MTDEVFYFTSGDKIYRYNPTNQDIRPLVTDFGGKDRYHDQAGRR